MKKTHKRARAMEGRVMVGIVRVSTVSGRISLGFLTCFWLGGVCTRELAVREAGWWACGETTERSRTSTLHSDEPPNSTMSPCLMTHGSACVPPPAPYQRANRRQPGFTKMHLKGRELQRRM